MNVYRCNYRQHKAVPVRKFASKKSRRMARHTAIPGGYRAPTSSAVSDDFAISTAVIEQGYRLLVGREAVACEKAMPSAEEEFSRKVGIMTRALRGVVFKTEVSVSASIWIPLLELISSQGTAQVIVFSSSPFCLQCFFRCTRGLSM